MRPLTQSEFRRLVIISGSLWIIGMVAEFAGEPFFSEDVRTVMAWNYWEAIASIRLLNLAYWYSIIAFAAGLIGFVVFKAWARGLLLSAYVVWALTSFVSGVMVFAPITSGFIAIAGDMIIMLLALSYFRPHSDYFAAQKNEQAVDNRG